jgi:hypothetical protein
VSSSKGTQINSSSVRRHYQKKMLKGICSRCRPRPYALKQHDLGGFNTSLAKAACVIAESYIKITNWQSSHFSLRFRADVPSRLITNKLMWSRPGCPRYGRRFREKLRCSSVPSIAGRGIFAPRDLHVVLAKHLTASNNFGRDGKGSARSLRARYNPSPSP